MGADGNATIVKTEPLTAEEVMKALADKFCEQPSLTLTRCLGYQTEMQGLLPLVEACQYGEKLAEDNAKCLGKAKKLIATVQAIVAGKPYKAEGGPLLLRQVDELGESVSRWIVWTKPLTLSVLTMGAELPGGSRSCLPYSDRKIALALASACAASHIEIQNCRREAPDVWSFLPNACVTTLAKLQ